MPKPGYVSITVPIADRDRLVQAAETIVGGEVPEQLRPNPPEALRIVLDEVEKTNTEPEEEG